MARAQTVDLLSFRRTFALVILLVVVPSAGLSGFGVLAIINERAAVEKRLETVWAGRLETLQARVLDALDGAQVETVTPLSVQALGVRVLDETFRVRLEAPFGVTVESEDRGLAGTVTGAWSQLSEAPKRLVFRSVTAPEGPWVLAVLRTDTHLEGGRVSAAALERVVRVASTGLVPANEAATFVLEPLQAQGPPPDSLLGRLTVGVQDMRDSALKPRELSARTLSGTLRGFRLVARVEGEDPVVEASNRNRTVYGILLGVFYLTLAIGATYTGRTLYREARLSRMKTDFVSLVSHELRTPLTSIRMFIDTLALGRVKSGAETQAVLEMLSQETARLSEMIERVLDWARIEGGRKQYDKQPLEVQALVDTAVSAFKTQRHGAPYELAVELPDGLPKVEVDAAAVSGAVLNLLSNAYKYTGDEKRIRLEAVGRKKGVAISVRDNGLGIAPSEQKRIFERFYRVDNLLTRSTEGSGLGLSIAQRIVQAHEGTLTVESVLGEGSTFTIWLPGAKVAEATS